MTPLLLVAGFLGAGKTTFLRGLLPALAGRGLRTRVFLNDFQNARVDAATLRDLAPDLVPVSGTCLCCESLDDLLGALAALAHGPGEVAVVEANGATDTATLIELVGSSPSLDHLAPPLQLTLVDAQRFGRRDWQNTMERDQIVTATHVALSRLDVVEPVRAAEVSEAVRAIAPRAELVTPEAMADVLDGLGRELRDVPGRRALAGGLPTAPAARTTEAHDPARHFASFEVDLPGQVDPEAFVRFLQDLPPEVLRAKGIVELRDPPGEKRSFQKVDAQAEISPCQLADPDEIAPVAVFIGPRLPTLAIRARLARLLG